MKSVAFCTLGCKVNQYETEAMLEMFVNAGYQAVDFDKYADIYVINTCTVTSISDRKSRQMIRRALRLNPDAYIVVCGCYAQTAPEKISAIDGVSLVLGTNERNRIVELAEKKYNGIIVNSISTMREFEKLTINDTRHRSRAYVKVQEGCNQFCSYCIIPYARGPIRSRPLAEIVEESKKLVGAGFTEIIYVGIHVASYGLDNMGIDLADMLIEVNKIDGLKRIRLSSIEPMTLNKTFCERIKDCDKLCPHFHLSLQSGCDDTLKRMNRRYTTDEYYEIIKGLRTYFPGCAITTDIMVGFPGETDEEFNKTLEFVKKVNFAEAHIFKYSRRSGTKADKMPDQIPPEIKELRSKDLFRVCDKSHEEFLNNHIGKTLRVLFEERSGDYMEGKTPDYATVRYKTDEDLTGKYLDVVCTAVSDGILICE